MPSQQSSIISSQKPVNIFYVWYSELCRRLNSSPAPAVKPAKPKCQTILDFVADRLKVEEWNPVINALRHDTSLHVISIKSRIGNCQFLHEIDTEDKARRMKRRYGYIWTAYILNSLLKSLSCTVRNTEVLTCLEFDGIPLFIQYLEPLLKALKKNKTLKSFSLSNCRISDMGCQSVCDYLKFAPNIEVLNLTGCGLTSESGEYLAKLIKFQQINRYCESWHNSLRYENPHNHTMRGIKRITLNRNPLFGDAGLDYILNELEDDLWIKALDMQKCGITENLSKRILDVVEYNQSLEIVDFRLNEQLSISTIEKILTILKEKYDHGHQPEFQWCNTTMSLAYESVLDTASNYTSVSGQIHRTKSVPNRSTNSCKMIECVRKIKTTDNVLKTNRAIKNNINEDIGQKVEELNYQLQEEIARRRETEKLNEELKRKLEEISASHLQIRMKSENNMKTLISAIQNLKPKQNGEIKSIQINNNGFNKNSSKNGLKKLSNGFAKEQNGFSKEPNGFSKEQNGFSTTCLTNKASTILEEILSSQNNESDNESDEDILNSYLQTNNPDKKKNKEKCYDNDVSDSQISLYQFMENLKSNNKNLSVKILNVPKTSFNEKKKHT